MRKIVYICDCCNKEYEACDNYCIDIYSSNWIKNFVPVSSLSNPSKKTYCKECAIKISNLINNTNNFYSKLKLGDLSYKLKEDPTLTITLTDEQLEKIKKHQPCNFNIEQIRSINEKVIKIENEYKSKITDSIDYIKDCLNHLCTVDEIELLKKLGFGFDED